MKKKKAEPAKRNSDGTRQVVIRERPSAEELRENAAKHVDYMAQHGWSYCATCRRTYSMASCWAPIAETGYCPYCRRFMSGEDEWVLSSRLPTVEEALSIPVEDRKLFEHVVIDTAYRSLLAEKGGEG
jgi:hypothetical protein